VKLLKLIQDPSYKIVRYKDSKWVRATKDKEMLALCGDMTCAFQVIYQDIKSHGGECDVLSREDFRF